MYAPNPNHQTLPAARRERFASVGLETASNARILTLCFDRLDRDLVAAREAITSDDHFATNDALSHAQELLGELAMMIDVTAWEHAGSLVAVYDYVLRLLMNANVHKSDSMVAEAQRLLAEIGEAFRTAAAAGDGPNRPTAGPEPLPAETTSGARWSVQA